MILSKKIGFIGAGKMADALIGGIIRKGISSVENIFASDKSKERLDYLQKKIGINVFDSNIETVKNSDIIFLSIKPQDFSTVLPEIKDYITPGKLVISIAAGVKTDYIEKMLKNPRVIRVMPNTPCQVGEMAGGFSAGKFVEEGDLQTADTILNSAGKVFLMKEELLDAVTGLSGSGPAFVSYIIQAFIDAGKKLGISENISTELTLQTFIGTAKLLQEHNISSEDLIKMVKSPGGTTASGLDVMENSELKNTIIRTIERAAARSKELGKN